jgi:hypothetical protein
MILLMRLLRLQVLLAVVAACIAVVDKHTAAASPLP